MQRMTTKHDELEVVRAIMLAIPVSAFLWALLGATAAPLIAVNL
jgi:hypothetical protein